MKAAIDIKIPEGTGDVKIELSSDKFTFVEGSYPKINAGAIAPEAYNTKTLTWTIKQTDKEQNLQLSLAIDERPDYNLGNITIKVTGKVTEFISDNGPLTDQIVGIEFVNNGVLERLRLGKSDAATEYYPNLTALSCEGNKLSYIPAKPEKMKVADYKVGKQEVPESKLASLALTGNAKSFVFGDIGF